VSTEDIAPAVPPSIVELSVNCVQFVQAALGIELDFSNETLPLLDHYARGAREQLQTRPEALALLAHTTGAYFGQVVASELTGSWRVVNEDPNGWLLCLQPVFLAFNPIGVAYDVLTFSTAHAGPASQLRLLPPDAEMVQARLLALPETSEDDYYTFSTRFDTLQITFEALRAQMSEGGQADVNFEVQDYVDEFDL
jgi:hypothetical protein